MTDNDDFENEVLEEIAQAVAMLPQHLQDLAAGYEPFVLHAAAAAGEVELVSALVDVGLSPDMYPGTEDEDDEPPLTWIARDRDRSMKKRLNVAKLLVERGAGLDEGLSPTCGSGERGPGNDGASGPGSCRFGPRTPRV